MDLKEIATVSGKGGLFRIVKPTRSGVILEPVDGKGGRFAAGPSTRVSLLKEISMYTTDEEGSVPLERVMEQLYQSYDGSTAPLSSKDASEDELRAFMEQALPNYDQDRVYVSDMRKLLVWYNLLAEHRADLFQEEPAAEDEPTPSEVASSGDAEEQE
ncbi:hypothetical protein SAMN05421823_101111 [Catalinimonas alkaloidigena]|uniref:Uncharacterized protein n=1 Tax=Catalinimonas alkaloidigena TaxID=1075417 RepID=A0A1G8WLZ4_9BACT|nr:DUF5606 domain-containing protein [Catalinimonas alkaloidigena]SDJ78675.1 hypothetical protein SAMN05421823_101111 [Catalinimonas alkaloidigena]